MFFFFKQKTAYEMRISDWSSDVCSSDLGGCDHAHPVVHPAGLPQLAYAGIDQRIAGAATLPAVQQSGIVAPREGVEIGTEVALRQIGDVIEQVMREFAPAQLGEEFLGIAHGAVILAGAQPHGMPELARADPAEMQKGGQQSERA